MPGFTPSLRATIESELQAAAIPGASIAVVDRAGRVAAMAAGLADVRTGRRATESTVYHLFSGTKLYTATAVLQLVEAGQLSLDAPGATWAPDVLGTSRVTVRQLLNHTSGLRDTLRAFLAVHPVEESPVSTAAALARFRIRSQRPPGVRVEYRNVNYALLGELVTRVSGRPYAEYVAERVLAPLGMPVTFAATPAMRAESATGYVGAWDALRFLAPLMVPPVHGGLFGARVGSLVELQPLDLDTAAIGGLLGAAGGFLPFLRSQLGDGAPVLRESTVRQMQTLTARGAPGITSRVGMGLGWKLGSVGGTAFLNHEGGGAGFTSETRLYPLQGVGIVVCMNRWRAPHRSHLVAHRVCEAIRRDVDRLELEYP